MKFFIDTANIDEISASFPSTGCPVRMFPTSRASSPALHLIFFCFFMIPSD